MNSGDGQSICSLKCRLVISLLDWVGNVPIISGVLDWIMSAVMEVMSQRALMLMFLSSILSVIWGIYCD